MNKTEAIFFSCYDASMPAWKLDLSLLIWPKRNFLIQYQKILKQKEMTRRKTISEEYCLISKQILGAVQLWKAYGI